ncbi:hypothetical protein SLS57_000328 [Botryosphaeria dothidea]
MQYLLPFGLLVAGAVSSPVELQKRAGYKCGSKTYSASDYNKCVQAACTNPISSGRGGYPHKYNNYEGINFGTLNGLLYEFPMITGGPWSSGSPGADRCIVEDDTSVNPAQCRAKGAITHSGASSKNGFVACQAI